MWRGGERLYWGKAEGLMERGEIKGIIVVFAWMWSDEKQLKPFVDLYWSLGWRCLICHADVLSIFFPEKATTLAFDVLNELVKELKTEASPVIFATFSGWSTGGLCKAIQLLDAKWEGEASMDEYQIIRDCICGQIYDSSPVGFIKEGDAPGSSGNSHQPRLFSWMAKAVSSGFDTLFPSSLQAQCNEYWQTLYSSVEMGPFLIFCSEEDKLASFRSICNSAQQLADLGGDVRLVKWSTSHHIGYYKFHRAEYRLAVTEFLNKASATFSQRKKQISSQKVVSGPHYDIADSVCNLHEAAATSNESLRRVGNFLTDQFYSDSTPNEGREAGSLIDEQRRELLHIPRMEPQGVLGQILYDVCVPKNVEGWDIKPGMYLKDRQAFASSRRLGPFNPIKCLLRSRL
ncbi:hypothetical protein LUZ62_044998 [Rhynchospora pubera]|uniref:Uncharacterized protein n=1 Tax=Rhynchospora pubera TaxID=906938 RepID=A0AAV8FS26_9POAL|nr:hypothetical protein LUZ62_044998 [Rhynchospora pubera]